MVFEHLNITGTLFCDLVLALSHNRRIVDRRGVADVKPSGGQGRRAVNKFLALHQSMPALIESGAGPDRHNNSFPHPWFGPFTAAQWLGLIPIHMSLHRKQLRLILRNGGATRP